MLGSTGVEACAGSLQVDGGGELLGVHPKILQQRRGGRRAGRGCRYHNSVRGLAPGEGQLAGESRRGSTAGSPRRALPSPARRRDHGPSWHRCPAAQSAPTCNQDKTEGARGSACPLISLASRRQLPLWHRAGTPSCFQHRHIRLRSSSAMAGCCTAALLPSALQQPPPNRLTKRSRAPRQTAGAGHGDRMCRLYNRCHHHWRQRHRPIPVKSTA